MPAILPPVDLVNFEYVTEQRLGTNTLGQDKLIRRLKRKAGVPVFANPQVLLITGDSQPKGSIPPAEQTAAQSAYVVTEMVKVLHSNGTWQTYTPGTLTGQEYGANQGSVGPELQFISRWRAKYPFDVLHIIKETISGGCQTKGAAVGAAFSVTATGTGSTYTATGTLSGNNRLIVGAGIETGVYIPFSGFLSTVGLAGGRSGPLFGPVAVTQHNGTASWSPFEGLAYGGNSSAVNNGAKARMTIGLAALINPIIFMHLHVIGTNDKSLTGLSQAQMTLDLAGFLNILDTDHVAYGASTTIALASPNANGPSQTNVRAAIAAEIAARSGSILVDMNGRTIWDGTHWPISELNYMADTAFTGKFGP